MNRLKYLIFVFSLLLTVNVKALDCDKTYLVQTVNSSGISDFIGCTDDYNEAKNLMRSYESTKINVAAIYKGNTLINARYALVNLDGRSSLTNMWQNESLSGTYYTYFDGNWGSDAAFLDYSVTKNTIKIKLSGAVGYIKAAAADIKPLSMFYAATVTANRTIRVRTSPTTQEDNQISTIHANDTYVFTEKVENDGYLWYKIAFNGSSAYIAGKELKTGTAYVKEATNYALNTYYLRNDAGSLVHYYRAKKSTYSVNLGAVNFLDKNVKYYSFDGNYFYTNLEEMLDDYYNGVYTHAVNREKPYYNYYMYLPIHNKSIYTADDLNQIIINKGYTRGPEEGKTYYTLENGWTSENRSKMSVMYNSGEDFIRAQETYGVNALLMFGTAINESATGTSALAFFKKNLFGMGAKDSCPISCAVTYNSVYDSVVGHASLVGGSYANPNSSNFYGSFYGNKGSGFGVNYASDPYWGEKTAKFAYQNDKTYGGQDYKAYTLGIKQSNVSVPLKKSPSDSSATIYSLKNSKLNHLVPNMSYIVTEKVYDENNTAWYRVYADTSLDQNQKISSSNYNFDYSYGYIKAEYLYVANNEPVINATSYSVLRGEEIDLLKNVTATDLEDGNLTDRLNVNGEVDNSVVGDYIVTYDVTDNEGFKTTKKVTITVNPSEAPTIEANDIEIKQFKPFNPLDHVEAFDINGSPITNINVTSDVNVNITGVYSVTYKVTANNLTVSKKIKVTVLKDELPVLTVNSRTIKLNDEFNYMSGVSAIDAEDGDITSNVIVNGTVDTTKKGNYNLTYSITDSANQTVSKEITIRVEDITYVKKDSDFYFNELKFENSKLNISGYIAIKGMNNTKNENILYDLIAKNNDTKEEIIYPLERYLDSPSRHYTDSKYDYSATWFKGSISLDNLNQGEYTLYVRARLNNYEATALFRNIFAKEMSTKGESNGKGFLFRNNNYLDSYPIELFVYNSGLISNKENKNLINMINNYKTLEMNKNNLSIKGTSYNIGTDYGKNVNVQRYIIFENMNTYERYTFNIGSIVGEDIPLNVSDGFTRVRGWFNTTIDISSIPVGEYAIYIQTIAGDTNDFGELNDIFLKDLSKVKGEFDNKKVTFNLKQNKRFRIEMKIEAL